MPAYKIKLKLNLQAGLNISTNYVGKSLKFPIERNIEIKLLE